MNNLHHNIQKTLEALSALKSALEEASTSRISVTKDEHTALCADLENLLLLRIEVLSAFELLVRLNPERAQAILLRRYLGRGVSPDRKFGGYEFELSTMLDDLVEIAGKNSLVGIVRSNLFDPEKLEDPRVVQSLAGALDCEPDEIPHWYQSTIST